MPRSILVLALLGITLGVGFDPAGADEPFPYELETGREVGLVLGGAAALGAGVWIDRGLVPLDSLTIAGLDRRVVNGFDRGATRHWSPGASRTSDILQGTLLVSPFLLVTGGGGAKQPWTVSAMYLETLLLNNGLTALLKSSVRRTRPYAYNDDPRISLTKKMGKDTRRSFPSGHTSNAFAAAIFLGTVFEKLNPQSSARGWVWGGALTAATATGCLRYLAGKHYPSDIIAGAVLGALVGYLVPKIHEADLDEGSADKSQGFRLAWGIGF